MMYDVTIAGSSLAGLAAATQLRGKRVLLIEPHSVGAVRTSARGTLLAVHVATGWRAALATNTPQQAEPHNGQSLGLETMIRVELGQLSSVGGDPAYEVTA